MYFDTFTLACVLSTASAMVVNSTRPATDDLTEAAISMPESTGAAVSEPPFDDDMVIATSSGFSDSGFNTVVPSVLDAAETGAPMSSAAPAVDAANDNSTDISEDDLDDNDDLATLTPVNATGPDTGSDVDADAAVPAVALNDTVPLLTPISSSIPNTAVIPLAAPNDTAVDISPAALVRPGPLPPLPVLGDGSTTNKDDLLHGLNIDVDPSVIVNNGFNLTGNNNNISINTSIILPININLTVNAWVDPILAPSVTYTKLVTECCLGYCLIKTVPYCPTMPVVTVSSCPGQCTTTTTECPYCVLATGCSTLTTVCSNTPVTVISPWCTYTVPPNPPECTPIIQTVTPGGKPSTTTRLVPVPIATKLPPTLPAPSQTPCPIAPVPLCSGQCPVPEKPPLPIVPSATHIPIAQPSGNPIPPAPVCPEVPAPAPGKPGPAPAPGKPGPGPAPGPGQPGPAPAPGKPGQPGPAPKGGEGNPPPAPGQPGPAPPAKGGEGNPPPAKGGEGNPPPAPGAPAPPAKGGEGNPPPAPGAPAPPAKEGEGNPPPAPGPGAPAPPDKGGEGNPPPAPGAPGPAPAGSNPAPPAQASTTPVAPPPAQGTANRLAVTGFLVGIIGVAMFI